MCIFARGITQVKSRFDFFDTGGKLFVLGLDFILDVFRRMDIQFPLHIFIFPIISAIF